MNAGQFVSRLTRKSRSNFFYAFLCLPRAQREAIYACYAFCRIVDDAVDLGQDRTAQRAELARWREEIARVYEGRAEHPAGQRLHDLRQIACGKGGDDAGNGQSGGGVNGEDARVGMWAAHDRQLGHSLEA